MSLCSFEKMNYKDCQISYNVQVNTDWEVFVLAFFALGTSEYNAYVHTCSKSTIETIENMFIC